MWQLLRTLTFPYLARRWERSLLIIASIALGVATLVSTRLLNNCIESVAMDQTTPFAGADLYVSNGEIGVARDLLDDLRKANAVGVKRFTPFVIQRIELPKMDNRSAAMVGLELPNPDASFEDNPFGFRVTPLKDIPLILRTPVVISRNLQNEREKLGQQREPLVIRVSNAPKEFLPVAVLDVDEKSAAGSFADNLVAMELGAALRAGHPENSVGLMALAGSAAGLFEARGERLTRIDVYLEPGADLAATRSRVQAILGERAAVNTPEAQRKSTEEVIGGLQTSFTVASIGALVVGLFLVYNALAVSVAERRHDIGILRSLGATRVQIARLFAQEAVLLGAVGAVVGIPLGTFIAEAALGLFRDELASFFLSGAIEVARYDWRAWILAVFAGMFTALLASLIPSLQAANDQPAEVVRRAPNHVSALWRMLHLTAVGVLVGMGVFAILGRSMLPPRVGVYAGLVIALVGMFLSLPLLLRLATWVMQPLLRRVLGVEARLAADNLTLAPGRTGIVVGALAAGVALMFQTAGVGRSNEEPIKAWIEQVIAADAYIFRGNIARANSSSAPMEATLAAEMKAAVPALESLVGVHFHRPEYNGTVVFVIAIDARNYRKGISARIPSGPKGLDAFQELANGNNCMVSDNFAVKHGVDTGDTLTLPGPRGPVKLKVIGRGLDYSWNKGTVFIDRTKFKELFGEDQVDIFHVFFKEGEDRKAAYAALRDAAGRRDLVVQDKEFLKGYLADVIDKIYKIAYVQQIVVGTVAAMGVITALLISVLQRRRELGLLRAVGATRGQILKSVLAEALLMGILGTLFGLFLGFPMEWFLLRVVIQEESGFFFPLIVPWKQILFISAVSIGIATLAGLLPALQAMRMRITDAIAYE